MNTLSLWNLSKERVYVKIKQPYIKDFFNYAIKFAGSEDKLARLLGKKRIYNIWVRKNSISFVPLSLIIEILNTMPSEKGLEFKNKIEENIEELRYGYGCAKSIKNPKLPIVFSPVLARVAGHLAGDGGIRLTKGDYAVYYTNKQFQLTEEFKQDIKQTFGDVKAYEYYKKSDGTWMIRFPSIVGVILMKFFGPMVGELKHVPDIIINADKESKSKFLKAIYDDEGCISLSSNRISFGISNDNIAMNVNNMLKEFGIRTGKITKREPTERWEARYEFGIFGKKDVNTFANEIGFNHSIKRKILKQFVDIQRNKKDRYVKGEISSLILENLKNHDMLNTYELAKIINRKPSHRFREQLYKLVNLNKVKTITIKRIKLYALK